MKLPWGRRTAQLRSETDQFSYNQCGVVPGCNQPGAYYTLTSYACAAHAASPEEENLSCCDGTVDNIDCPIIGWIDGKAITHHNL